MKTFIVLIPITDSVSEPRKACEMIENTQFKFDEGEFVFAHNVLKKVMFELGIEESSNIEVEAITDFMDRVNDQEFDDEEYFISYVYAI